MDNRKLFLERELTFKKNLSYSTPNRLVVLFDGLPKEINQKEGCYFSRMSGSGSVCYGLFESQKSANVALKKIKSKYSKFWFSVAKTI